MHRVGTKENESARLGRSALPWHILVRLGITAAVVLFVFTAGWFIYQHLRAEATDSDAPVVCREAIWDFGELSQEKPAYLHHRFKLENLTKEGVRIVKVVPDCGCIVPEKPPSEIGPGAMVELPLNVNAAGRPGPFQKLVHVVLGTTPVSKVTLTIRGKILPSPALYLAPVKLEYGTLSEDETKARSVKIARYDGSPVRFQQIKSQSKALQVKEVVSGDEEDSFIELTVSLNGSTLRAGDFRTSISVVTEHPGYSEIEIPVLAKITVGQHGLVSSVFIGGLSRSAFQDKSLADGSSHPPNIEKIDYLGEGPITVKFIAAVDPSTNSVRPVVRVSRRDEAATKRICRGSLLLWLVGRKNPVRIPLTAYLSE
jgi:hypothetical protein